MAFLKEKQGELGKLEEKSDLELQDVLTRQKKLLAHKKVVAMMPDKGAKISRMIEKIETILKQRAEIDETADMFHQMALDADKSRQSREGGEDDSAVLKDLINQPYYRKLIQHDDSERDDTINTYHKVLKQSAKHSHIGSTSHRFLPNQSIKAKDITELPIDRLVNLKLEDPKLSDIIDPTIGKVTASHIMRDKKKSVIDDKLDVENKTDAAEKVSEWLDKAGPVASTEVRDKGKEGDLEPKAEAGSSQEVPVEVNMDSDTPNICSEKSGSGDDVGAREAAGNISSKIVPDTTSSCADSSDDRKGVSVVKNESKENATEPSETHFEADGMQSFASICENQTNVIAEKGQVKTEADVSLGNSSGASKQTDVLKGQKPATGSADQWAHRQPVEKMPSGLRSPSGSVVSNASSRLRFRYDECLDTAATWRDPLRGSVKHISLKDSILLMDKQKQEMQELVLKHAGQRLAHRLQVTPAVWNPEGSSKMNYRGDVGNDSDDGDSDDEEAMDYPD